MKEYGFSASTKSIEVALFKLELRKQLLFLEQAYPRRRMPTFIVNFIYQLQSKMVRVEHAPNFFRFIIEQLALDPKVHAPLGLKKIKLANPYIEHAQEKRCCSKLELVKNRNTIMASTIDTRYRQIYKVQMDTFTNNKERELQRRIAFEKSEEFIEKVRRVRTQLRYRSYSEQYYRLPLPYMNKFIYIVKMFSNMIDPAAVNSTYIDKRPHFKMFGDDYIPDDYVYQYDDAELIQHDMANTIVLFPSLDEIDQFKLAEAADCTPNPDCIHPVTRRTVDDVSKFNVDIKDPQYQPLTLADVQGHSTKCDHMYAFLIITDGIYTKTIRYTVVYHYNWALRRAGLADDSAIIKTLKGEVISTNVPDEVALFEYKEENNIPLLNINELSGELSNAHTSAITKSLSSFFMKSASATTSNPDGDDDNSKIVIKNSTPDTISGSNAISGKKPSIIPKRFLVGAANRRLVGVITLKRIPIPIYTATSQFQVSGGFDLNTARTLKSSPYVFKKDSLPLEKIIKDNFKDKYRAEIKYKDKLDNDMVTQLFKVYAKDISVHSLRNAAVKNNESQLTFKPFVIG